MGHWVATITVANWTLAKIGFTNGNNQHTNNQRSDQKRPTPIANNCYRILSVLRGMGKLWWLSRIGQTQGWSTYLIPL